MSPSSVNGTMQRTLSTDRKCPGPQQDIETMTFMRRMTGVRWVGTCNCVTNPSNNASYFEKDNQTVKWNSVFSSFCLLLQDPKAFGFKEWHRGSSVPEQLSSVPPNIWGVVEGTGQTPSSLRLRRLQEGFGKVWNTLPVWGKPRRLLQGRRSDWRRDWEADVWGFINHQQRHDRHKIRW